MSACVEVRSEGVAALASALGEAGGKALVEMRHELVDAQVEILRMYMEKQPKERLLEALERLIDCTRASFRIEEELMERLTGDSDPRHRDRHREVLGQLSTLREYLKDLDRGSLLAQLIYVDRQLTAHLSVAADELSAEQGLH